MYVCICNAVTDGQIRQAASEGITRVRELGSCLGVAQCCGKCALQARAVLEESNRDLSMGGAPVINNAV